MKKLFFLLSTLIATSLCGSESNPEYATNFLMISSEGDSIGKGQFHIYDKNDGLFQINENENHVYVNFLEYPPGKGSDWDLDFQDTSQKNLTTGLYLGASRYPFGKIGLSITDRSGCNHSRGHFEILEIERDDLGDIKRFAVNAFQRCENRLRPPLFASIRYNSSIPVKASVSEIFGTRSTPESFLILKKYNSTDCSYELKKSGENLKFDFESFSDLEDGVLITIKEYDPKTNHIKSPYMFEFNTLSEKGFVGGLWEMSDNQNKERSYFDGPCIRMENSKFYTYTKGEFKVIKIEKNNYGEIEELALNFIIFSDEDTFEGAIRYRSNVPVDLFNPFKE